MQSDVVTNLYLRALLEQYDVIDCWCGSDFREVVATYLSQPTDLGDPEELDPSERNRFSALVRTAPMTDVERRTGLLADVEGLLRAGRDEGARRRAVVEAGGEDLFDFSAFWMPTGEDCASRFPATVFLLLTRAYANEAASELRRYDDLTAHAVLEAAEREAEALTDVQ